MAIETGRKGELSTRGHTRIGTVVSDRSKKTVVVESDTLAKDEVGAIFAYLHRRLKYPLHCIIDTAGKSLHAWFDAPKNPLLENRLKAGLVALGCDPKVFTHSQPVRVPGAYREGKLQRLVWLKD